MNKKNDWVNKSYYEAIEREHGLQYIKRHTFLLSIYKFTRWNWIGELLCFLDHLDFKITLHRKIKRVNYQSIIEEHLSDITDILKSTSLPDPIELNGIDDIDGFGYFNAESIPWFGENYISINAGVFYNSHTLVRCLQPFLLAANKNDSTPYVWKYFFTNQFVRSSVAYITHDHTRSLSPIFIIPEDDSLLSGIEQFVISHEYAHLMLKIYERKEFQFEKYFNDEIIGLINSDEEVTADAIAILLLYNVMNFKTKSPFTFYAPLFLFKLLSCYEQEKLIPTPMSHPTNGDRHEYIKNMILQLDNNDLYLVYDKELNNIWEANKNKIEKRVEKINADLEKYLDTIKDLYNRYGNA
ncbi:hypothetical protein LJC52_02655 [Bacteroidales bacterium OttesenSCG-928-A17]|nr:hypothetical protein [Bacteroidales bacterium OttesenSCG-928-A17]